MGDDAARAIYLLMLGALVASGVLATYRGRMGAALRHAFIWAMIFAAVALLYLVFNPGAGFIPTPQPDDRQAARESAMSDAHAGRTLHPSRRAGPPTLLRIALPKGPGAKSGAAHPPEAIGL